MIVRAAALPPERCEPRVVGRIESLPSGFVFSEIRNGAIKSHRIGSRFRGAVVRVELGEAEVVAIVAVTLDLGTGEARGFPALCKDSWISNDLGLMHRATAAACDAAMPMLLLSAPIGGSA